MLTQRYSINVVKVAYLAGSFLYANLNVGFLIRVSKQPIVQVIAADDTLQYLMKEQGILFEADR
jgi:hypothetical protein